MRPHWLAFSATIACAASATSAADAPRPAPPEPTRMNIEVSAADATAQWDRAAALLTQCAPADITVWYPMGSAHLRAAPEKNLCRVDVDTEIEGGRRHLTCALAIGAWGWGFVSDGGKPRQAPPRDPPPAMAAKCQ